METKYKYFKFTTFGRIIIFLSFFFVIIIIPVVVDAYGGPIKYCFSSDDCYNTALNCPGTYSCPDDRPGYVNHCALVQPARDCLSVREKGPVACNDQRLTACTYVLAPTCTLSANPSSIVSGGSSILTWSSTNANKCSATWTASLTTSGTQSVSPSSTTTYNMTCTRTVGGFTADCSAKVTVGAAPTLSVVLTATPSSGTAPLNNVDLKGVVSGTATGIIVY